VQDYVQQLEEKVNQFEELFQWEITAKASKQQLYIKMFVKVYIII
jgi:hypothetical protein